MPKVKQIAVMLLVVASYLMMIPAHAAFASSMHDGDRTDPITGLRWQRTADARHPAAPPRLAATADFHRIRHDGNTPAAICMRAGDRVLLESRDADSLLQLNAVAMQSGAIGDRVRARIVVTGAQVQMTVLSAGTGTLAAYAGVRQ